MARINPVFVVIPVVIALAGGTYFFYSRSSAQQSSDSPSQVLATPKPKINTLDIKERPYVTLAPLTNRNELQFTVHTLPKKATQVEVLLEYDRNKGVLDAVLKNFSLSSLPSINTIFLGSKSSGGHITYHDDVVGGSITMTFSGGDESYSLKVPWRYDDTQPRYSQIASSDAKFQLILDEPYRTPKIVVMQSPGLPAAVDGQVLLGPYLVRGVGVLPNLIGQLTMHLGEADPNAKLLLFNGQTWQEQPATITDRTLTAKVPLAQAYLVIR